MTMRNVVTSRDYRDISADAVRQAILGVADCRSLIDLRNTLFCHIDSLIGVAAMGLYLFDSDDELRYVASCRAPQGFLDDYQREYRKVDTMLECILARRHTVDGFRFHGPAKWRHCGNYDLLRGWGFYHNMAGALVVNGRTAGVLYVATAHEVQPFEDIQVGRLDLMCRAGSLALNAMHARERLWSELSNIAAADWREVWSEGRELPGTGRAPDDIKAIERLPTRSREVALLLCRGQSNKVIARQLGISVYTVKEHVHNLCRRFGAINRTELVRCLLKSS